MDFTWMTALKLAATTGIFTAALTQIANWLRERSTSKNKVRTEASYLAIRLAVILETFVVQCLYRAWHDSSELAEGARELTYSLPKLAAYPQDPSDWKSLHQLDPRLTGEVLSFQNEITAAEMSCEFQGVREGNQIASADETIIAGANAWALAKTLREKFRLSAITIKHVDYLEEEHRKIQHRHKEWVERTAIV